MATAALTLLILSSVRYGLSTPILDPDRREIIIQNGQSLNLTCYGSTPVKWEFKNMERKQIQQDNKTVVRMEGATYKDTGPYRCVYNITASSESASVHLFVRDTSNYWNTPAKRIIAYEETDVVLPCLLTDPSINESMISLIHPEHIKKPLVTSFNAKVGYTIYNVQKDYQGTYVCLAKVNGTEKKSIRIALSVKTVSKKPPSVTLESTKYIRIHGEDFLLKCTATDTTKPSIRWELTRKNITGDTEYNYSDGTWITDSTIRIPSVDYGDSGDYTCIGENRPGSNRVSANLQVIEKSFVNISTSQNTVISLNVGDNLELTVDIEAYPDALSWKWEHVNPENANNTSTIPLQETLLHIGPYRSRSAVTLNRLQKNEAGNYTFYASNTQACSFLTFTIIVYSSPRVEMNINSSRGYQVMLCRAWGIPLPTIQWRHCPGISCKYENSEPFPGNVTERLHNNHVTSVLNMEEHKSNSTIFCLASNIAGKESAKMPFYTKLVAVTSDVDNLLFSPSSFIAISFVGIIFFLLSVILFYKCQQKPKHEVRWQIVQESEGNFYTCIDPMELPYDEKWEFPRDNLQLGVTIGAGAFGKVVEATAFGLGKDDSALKVAVKMLKANAHSVEVEALMSELKILIHLGHHKNIVNLLGSCTYGGPVLVITEYCHNGDLLNFLRRKAESMNRMFTEGLQEFTEYKNMSVEHVSDSGFGSQGDSTNIVKKPDNPVTKPHKVDPLEEEEMDDDDDSPLNLHDLLSFSVQVAQGMSFLASKNCIHRDVAARNVLLTQGRLAKICDFGLARDIEDDSNYVVKGNARLPVKWMAPESIFDCIYTVQSDVWSYGILLWEIFSLGRSPYSGIIVNRKFYKMIKEGYKMDCPDYAPTEIYRLMKACWDLKPMLRPTFSQISDIISRQMSLIKDQEYANIIQEEEQCMDVKCVDIQEPLIKGNNYQFC